MRKILEISGQRYALRVPTVKEWRMAIAELGGGNDQWHWEGIHSWCKNDTIANGVHSTLYGYMDGMSVATVAEDTRDKTIGFRPVLEPLDAKDQFDKEVFSNLANGTTIQIGALFLDDEAIAADGPFITRYTPGAKLHMTKSRKWGGAPKFVVFNGILICQKNVLNNISWKDLINQGIAYNHSTKLTGNRQIQYGDFSLEETDTTVDWGPGPDENCDDECWSYLLTACCNVDELFGFHVETDENDDYINVYAYVDAGYDHVRDELLITLVKGDGSEDEGFVKIMSEEEKAIIQNLVMRYEMNRLKRELARQKITKGLE